MSRAPLTEVEIGRLRASVAALPFAQTFEEESRSVGAGSKRTTGATSVVWVGEVLGETIRSRSTVRTRLEGMHFMTPANARIRDAGGERARSGGYFIDIHLRGPFSSQAKEELLKMATEYEERVAHINGEEPRPVLVRDQRERLRTGRLGADAVEEKSQGRARRPMRRTLY